MKKIFSAFLVGAISVCSLFAEHSFGIRGSLGVSNLLLSDSQKTELGEDLAAAVGEAIGTPWASYSVSNDAAVGGGFAFWGNYSLPSNPAFGIQGELGFLFGNGTTIKCNSGAMGFEVDGDVEFSFTTMELPVLLTYTVNKGGFFEFIPQGGLYLSIPMGKAKMETTAKGYYLGRLLSEEEETEKVKINSSVLVGTALGADFALNFSEKSALLFNLRYMIDFNKLKIDGDEVARRSMFLMSAGYRHTIR